MSACRIITKTFNLTISNRTPNITLLRCLSNINTQTPNNRLLQNTVYLQYSQSRFKSKSKKAASTSESESSEEDVAVDKNSKLINANLGSLRVDGIVKAGLGIARNKVEVLFYESKIRLNEKKLTKKSEMVSEGDEVDVIKSVHPENPGMMTVARVEVVKIVPGGDHFKVKLKRTKSLLVENYDKN